MTRTSICVVVFTAVTSVAAQAPPRSVQDAPAGDAEKGRAVYIKDGCYQCHGREGQGSPATGPRLAPDPSPFPRFAQYVRQPRGEMPPYTTRVLTDAEIADIYAFLKTRPRPPAVAKLPF